MRVDNHVHIRHIMLYHFEKNHTAAEAFRDLNELFGEGTIGERAIGERQVRRWFKRFKSGHKNLEDDQALLQAVEEDESLTTRMLAEPFDVEHSTIVKLLKRLGKVWKLAGRVPNELSDDTYSEKRLRQNA